jgi:hypothetical protein
MSAGDVLFIGWTGGSPNYKEIEPQIQIEPSATLGFINKRVTINRICFDKDKAAVIGNLPSGIAALSSVYIDTDGSVKTQALGGGYTLLSVSDASIAKGFSRVSAQYSKTALGIFEIGLPDGLSVECINGACRIKYLTHTLEEIDSGTGTCTSGLSLEPENKVMIRQTPPIGPYRTFSGGIGSLYVDPGFEFLISENNFYTFNFKCNGVLFETISATLAESNYGNLKSAVASRLVPVVGVQTKEQHDAYVLSTDYEARTAELQNGQSELQIKQIGKIVFFRPSRVSYTYGVATINGEQVALQQFYDEIVYQYDYVDLNQYVLNPSLLFPKWEKTNNTIKLLIDGKPIREYDITGLS